MVKGIQLKLLGSQKIHEKAISFEQKDAKTLLGDEPT